MCTVCQPGKMWLKACCVLLLVAAFTHGKSVNAKTPPVWPAAYQVSGNLQLPYAELDEDFTAYYNATSNRSRIDYYGQTVMTYQFSPNGTNNGSSYKIVYMSTIDKLNTRSCFLTNGTGDNPGALQSVLPNLTGFSLMESNMTYGDQQVDKWFMMTVKGKKKNTYTMMVDTKTQSPVRYEMFGYDSLLGSHYDKYYVNYKGYDDKTTMADKIFQVPNVTNCTGYPGPGDSERRATDNPMREYINHDDSHQQDMFNKFKKVHGKNYDDEKEHSMREASFRQNVRFIHSMNRQPLSYKLAVNHMADRSREELKLINGRLHSDQPNSGLPFKKSKYDTSSLPDQLDWRLFGAVNPVKDQAVCGSCWSFGTTGTIEGAYFLATGNLIRLSQQQLMDCSWGQGNNACDGGEDFRAYDYIMKHGGLATSDDYGPYKAQDMKCFSDHVNSTVMLESYVNITAYDQEALKAAMVYHGPISVGIDASHLSLSFYANGVYYEPKCRSDPDGLDHAVLAVGYGVMDGQPYWLVKNSWSTYWGNDGYVLMSMKDNNCGVATSATFVNIKK